MKDIDKAWLAGIIDGEGSIFIMKQRRKDRERDTNYILRVVVSSTDPYMATECHNLVGGPVIAEVRDNRNNNSDTLRWALNGKRASSFLKEILPYMRVKTKQAELAIEFQSTTKKHYKHMKPSDYQKQQELYLALKQAKVNLKIGKHLSKVP